MIQLRSFLQDKIVFHRGADIVVKRSLNIYVILFVFFNTFLHAESIVGSKHDLSVRGPGPTKSPFEREICIFCHAPHSASTDAPLWNRYSSGAQYKIYESTTIKATIGQPTGASKLCLSCHDGTVALGMVRNREMPIRFAGGITALPPGRANLGTDLGDDHPISFRYNTELAEANGELNDPSELRGEVRLENGDTVQCTSCHNAHDNVFGNFLVMDNYGSALCMQCHDKNYWEDSVHRTSTAKWNGRGASPWENQKGGSVEANGCENCHRPHTAGGKQRLLKHSNEEDNCLPCHNGNVASKNIEAEFGKSSRHDIVATAGVHDPLEDIVNPSVRHVECNDCHNPHAIRVSATSAPDVSGALNGVKGMNASGTVVASIRYQYELCFRCHADSADKGPARVDRAQPQTNVRLEFDPGNNSSYHPVVSRGKNANVPSLINPLNETSLIYCTDCHSNNEANKDKASGPAGPHGSIYEPILKSRLVLTDFSSESAAAYALCYNCHDRDSILGDQSFKYHSKHIKDEGAACTTCHDSHSSDNTHLINFNIKYVSENSEGMLSWVDTGNFAGTCNLKCHGADHPKKKTLIVIP